ncbi:hypothetical protein ABID23_000246 [Bartonella silvatica]|uniref:Uncharacterized protein n=1 Tax=Bartonella silvatica TaxID=357760 RepID=A0ABV2HF58_9HYPH
MKQLINISRNNKISAIIAAMIVFFMNSPLCAQNNLEKAGKALGAFQKELVEKIIPVAAAVILLCLAIGYAGRYIEKGTFVRWAIGVVIAGSATQIVAMLFNP